MSFRNGIFRLGSKCLWSLSKCLSSLARSATPDRYLVESLQRTEHILDFFCSRMNISVPSTHSTENPRVVEPLPRGRFEKHPNQTMKKVDYNWIEMVFD